jgi:hypothetical protein
MFLTVFTILVLFLFMLVFLLALRQSCGSRFIESGSGSRVLMTQNVRKKIQMKIYLFFFDQKLQFTYPQAFIKEIHPTGEAFRPQERTSSTVLKQLNFKIFIYFSGSVLPSWIRIRIANPDPDIYPGTPLNLEWINNTVLRRINVS